MDTIHPTVPKPAESTLDSYEAQHPICSDCWHRVRVRTRVGGSALDAKPKTSLNVHCVKRVTTAHSSTRHTGMGTGTSMEATAASYYGGPIEPAIPTPPVPAATSAAPRARITFFFFSLFFFPGFTPLLPALPRGLSPP